MPTYENIPTLSSEAEAIARRRRIAEAMLASAQQPAEINAMAGGRVIPFSPLQGLGQLAKAWVAKEDIGKAEKEMSGLSEKRRQMVADELANIRAISQGMPERSIEPLTPVDDEGNINLPAIKAAVPGDANRAIEEALFSQTPEAQRYGTLLNTRQQAKEARIENAQNKLDQIEMQVRMGTMAKKEAAEQSAELKRELQENAFSQQKLMAQLAAGLRQPPAAPAPIQIVAPDGTVKLVDRQGNLIKDLGAIGKPSAGFEKAAAAKKKMGEDINATIQELETATKKGGLIDQSTGSGIGAGIDIAAGMFGTATPGSIAVGRLKPIFDMVLKMVPRFEGPQSDKDTASYREAAGDIANPAMPNERKKAAATEILRLMKARRGQFVDKAIEGTEADIRAPALPTGSTPAIRTVDW